MKKCLTCVWADTSSGTKIFCPFPSCVKKDPETESEKEDKAVENDRLKEGIDIDESP